MSQKIPNHEQMKIYNEQRLNMMRLARFDQERFDALVEEIERRGYRVNVFDARVYFSDMRGFVDMPRITFEIIQMPPEETDAKT